MKQRWIIFPLNLWNEPYIRVIFQNSIQWYISSTKRRNKTLRRGWAVDTMETMWYLLTYLLTYLLAYLLTYILWSLAEQWATGFTTSLGQLPVSLLRPMWSLFCVGRLARLIAMSSSVVLFLYCRQLVSNLRLRLTGGAIVFLYVK